TAESNSSKGLVWGEWRVSRGAVDCIKIRSFKKLPAADTPRRCVAANSAEGRRGRQESEAHAPGDYTAVFSAPVLNSMPSQVKSQPSICPVSILVRKSDFSKGMDYQKGELRHRPCRKCR